jgi:hypothetical protein
MKEYGKAAALIRNASSRPALIEKAKVRETSR